MPGERPARNRWYRLRFDVNPSRVPGSAGRLVHVIAWRKERGETARFWCSLELHGTRKAPELHQHAQAQGQPEAILEAIAAARSAEVDVDATLATLWDEKKTFGLVAW